MWVGSLTHFQKWREFIDDCMNFNKVLAIKKTRLSDAIPLDDFETEYSNNSEKLKTWFKTSVLPHRKLLKNTFNITVHKDTDIIPFINRLLTKLGLKLKQSRRTADIRYYRLDAELALDEDRLNVLRFLNLNSRTNMLKAKRIIAKSEFMVCSRGFTKEAELRDAIALRVNGEIEVTTESGRIDILTENEIIEVKSTNAWKSGIGQLIAYKTYYPKHKMVLHLFGKCSVEMLAEIKSVCSVNSIDVVVNLSDHKKTERSSVSSSHSIFCDCPFCNSDDNDSWYFESHCH